MSDYQLQQNIFTIKNYNHKPPFASFLPGIAGPLGIPLWAFYVNRAQGISGFGIRDKNQPMMPFTPANKAYESVATSGFRTFIKHKDTVYEPFHITTPYPHEMSIHQSSFSLREHNDQLGITTEVSFFGLPQESLAALVRKTSFTNTSNQSITFEVLDGLAEFLPVGIQNDVFKSLSNIMASWVSVEELDHDVGFFKLRSSTNDSSEVKEMKEGHFYLGIHNGKRIRPVVDPSLVFAHDTSKQQPIYFKQHSIAAVKHHSQVTTNIIPAAFIPLTVTLKPQESSVLYSAAGYVKEFSELLDHLDEFSDETYWQAKEQDAADVISTITSEVSTITGRPVFDAYVEQSYLDNILRGGYPHQLGANTYHLYSRRHGDLERDYNFFSISPEYYSQGNGNFRDVCQNRRLDVIFHPEIKRSNIHQFLSLIQLDGYNPLSINGSLFQVSDHVAIEQACAAQGVDIALLSELLQESFTPGKVIHHLTTTSIPLNFQVMELFDVIMLNSVASPHAQFGEGYWTDHFTYVLDMIEAYEGIYPDEIDNLLYLDMSYKYFESPVTVKPLAEKITTIASGGVRQYHGLRHPDQEKIERLQLDEHGTNWTLLNGKPYQSNLYVKLLTLVLTKHSLLDRFDYGIEMEADKPGWNDAMNGLPGLFGSGISETLELLRIVDFLMKHYRDMSIDIISELTPLYQRLKSLPEYETRLSAREEYRHAIRFGPLGEMNTISTTEIHDYLTRLQQFIHQQIHVLLEKNNGIIPTFLYCEIDQFTIDDASIVNVKSIKEQMLPMFLEAPARLFKTNIDRSTLQTMHRAIQQSELYDAKLKVFKTSVSLAETTHEIGRIKAFTPGWLERESNFLHMTYKYLLGLLQAGIYDEFYQALETNLVCFMDPETYGRSPLENSSFIASSNNPDPKIHGQGFFARLSGSTVEALHMWYVMMTGGHPFMIDQGELVFSIQPKLHKDFFNEEGEVRFRLFHRVDVTIRNKNKVSTYDQCVINTIELGRQEERISFDGPNVRGHYAEQVRSGYYDNITFIINE